MYIRKPLLQSKNLEVRSYLPVVIVSLIVSDVLSKLALKTLEKVSYVNSRYGIVQNSLTLNYMLFLIKINFL